MDLSTPTPLDPEPALPTSAPAEEDPKARARRYAEELGEPNHRIINIFARLIRWMGPAFCEERLAETREIEANGGLWVVDEKRRRTPVGTFLVLCKRTKRAIIAIAIGAHPKRKKKPAPPAFSTKPSTTGPIPPPAMPLVGSGRAGAPPDPLREAFLSTATDPASLARFAAEVALPTRTLQLFAEGKPLPLSAAQTTTFRGRVAKKLGVSP